ncbi:hypothetical protein C2E21_4086 [Chlorella sorokiniana]|uniref:DUF6737 domain-containing protein n=1 Tax=Chlorella sorokiniana TaxID=3076 RepID=A0A2P6TSM6_CHLSO|nr:hypothetical protein C2E21_4086 [Chlorella sorokiniana]|eukprot:PRW57056.1 hypothetical protein C2E21_4086 [Chlorella sorokiniana]
MLLAAQRCLVKPHSLRHEQPSLRRSCTAAAPAARLRRARRVRVHAAADDDSEQPYQLDSNVWTHKPAWCQPWSILATGSTVVAGVWAVSSGSPGWTAAAALPVAAWWWLFLGIYPQQFRQYAEGLNAQQQQLMRQRRQQQLEEQRRRQQQAG